MGMLTRLTNTDYELFKEIELRAERAKHDSWVNTERVHDHSLVLTTRSDQDHSGS
jgi:hypothetical protein